MAEIIPFQAKLLQQQYVAKPVWAEENQSITVDYSCMTFHCDLGKNNINV